MVLRALVACLIAFGALSLTDEASAQVSRDMSPFLTYPPQGSCSILLGPSTREWLCDITALSDPVIEANSETPGWTVEFFRSGETTAFATQT